MAFTMKIGLIIIINIICCSYSEYYKYNETAEIKVIEYSIWMSNLPTFELPIINDYVFKTLNIPRELSIVTHSLGFSALVVFIAIALVLIIIFFALIQICCYGCGARNVYNDKCQRISGKILSVLVLISMVIACTIGIYFFSRYYSSVWNGIDNTKNVIYDKRDLAINIKTKVNSLDRSITNISTPILVLEIENGTYRFDYYLSSTDSTKARAVEQWGPMYD